MAHAPGEQLLHPAQAPLQAPHPAQLPPQEDLPCFLSRIIPRMMKKHTRAMTRISVILMRFAASQLNIRDHFLFATGERLT